MATDLSPGWREDNGAIEGAATVPFCANRAADRRSRLVDFSLRGHASLTVEPFELVMRKRSVSVRIVPLRSDEAADSYVEGSIDERLALVTTLSRSAWAATGRPYPSYTRATSPVVITRLGDQ
jgi:hypothetical protein